MSDKERLENMSPIGFDLNGNVLLKSEDYHWLMEQAERVEELEKINYDLKSLYIHLEKTTERYKQALEFYADEDNYCVSLKDDFEPILQDNGKTAQQALGWGEEN